jgi:hypothetical protein
VFSKEPPDHVQILVRGLKVILFALSFLNLIFVPAVVTIVIAVFTVVVVILTAAVLFIFTFALVIFAIIRFTLVPSLVVVVGVLSIVHLLFLILHWLSP